MRQALFKYRFWLAGLIMVLVGLVVLFLGCGRTGTLASFAVQVGSVLLATGGIAILYEYAMSTRYLEMIQDITDCNRLVWQTGLVSVDLQDDPAALSELMQGARRLDIAGTTCFELVRNGRDLLRQEAKRGCVIRFILSDPSCPAVKAAQTEDEQTGARTLGDNVRSTLRELADLWHEVGCPKTLQVMLSPRLPRCALILRDGCSVVRHTAYVYDGRAVRKVSYTFARRESGKNAELLGRFVRHFETLWDRGQPYRLEPPCSS